MIDSYSRRYFNLPYEGGLTIPAVLFVVFVFPLPTILRDLKQTEASKSTSLHNTPLARLLRP